MNKIRIEAKTAVQRVVSASGEKLKCRPRIQRTVAIRSGLRTSELDGRIEGVFHVDSHSERYIKSCQTALSADKDKAVRNRAALNTYGNKKNTSSKNVSPKNGLGITKTEEGVLISKTGNDKNYTLYISETDGGNIQAKFQNGRLYKYFAKSASGLETTCVNKPDGNWAQYVELDSSGNKTVWSWENGHVVKTVTKSNGETIILKSASDGISRIEELPDGGKRYIEDYSKNRKIVCDYDKNGNWTSYSEEFGKIKMVWKFDEIGRIVTETKRA